MQRNKKKYKSYSFEYKKEDNDVKVKCIWSKENTNGRLWKTKLLKRCGVASVVPTTMMKKGFRESPIKKGYE
jgi:hypothetical protein